MTFDENEIVTQLGKLPNSNQLAFALSCAERLFPGYLIYTQVGNVGNAPSLRNIIDLAWESAASDRIVPNIEDHMTEVESLFVGDDENINFASAVAEDAVVSVYYALVCAKDRLAQEAGLAARRAYEAVDDYASHLNDNLGYDEQEILQNDVVQREICRQVDDLKYISGKGSSVQYLREKSRQDAKDFLPWYAAYDS